MHRSAVRSCNKSTLFCVVKNLFQQHNLTWHYSGIVAPILTVPKLTRAASCKNGSHFICSQHSSRQACAFAQSSKELLYLLMRPRKLKDIRNIFEVTLTKSLSCSCSMAIFFLSCSTFAFSMSNWVSSNTCHHGKIHQSWLLVHVYFASFTLLWIIKCLFAYLEKRLQWI